MTHHCSSEPEILFYGAALEAESLGCGGSGLGLAILVV